jgi:predicted ABC-type ATPase
MMDGTTKDAVMIGGPNGAGKTTWAVRNLPSILGIDEFLNADEIARGLSPLRPESNAVEAGQLMIERLNEHMLAQQSFAFETTCAGHAHARRLEECRAAGYWITVVFLWLPTAQMALERVARRVGQGGHHIPDDVVIRRHAAGLRNLRHLYLPLADDGFIYDNSDGSGNLIAERRDGGSIVVHDVERWSRILDATR